jgi:hypothetical protein
MLTSRIPGTRSRAQSPDAGRGADAEREGRLVIGDWIMGIGDWVEGGGWPYYASSPFCGGAPKGARSGWGCGWVDGLARRIRVDL